MPPGVKVTTGQQPRSDMPGHPECFVYIVFDNHPALMGQAALNRVLDLVAEKYVEANYDALVAELKPADILSLVQAKVAERLLAALTRANQPTERQRRGKYFGFTEKPLMVSWDEFLREGGAL